jgi:hypothetical protein
MPVRALRGGQGRHRDINGGWEPIMATASGNRLTFITAEAVHAEMERLIPRFERQHGIDVDVNYDVNPAVAKRVMGDLARHLDRFGAQHYARRRGQDRPLAAYEIAEAAEFNGMARHSE